LSASLTLGSREPYLHVQVLTYRRSETHNRTVTTELDTLST